VTQAILKTEVTRFRIVGARRRSPGAADEWLRLAATPVPGTVDSPESLFVIERPDSTMDDACLGCLTALVAENIISVALVVGRPRTHHGGDLTDAGGSPT